LGRNTQEMFLMKGKRVSFRKDRNKEGDDLKRSHVLDEFIDVGEKWYRILCELCLKEGSIMNHRK